MEINFFAIKSSKNDLHQLNFKNFAEALQIVFFNETRFFACFKVIRIRFESLNFSLKLSF